MKRTLIVIFVLFSVTLTWCTKNNEPTKTELFNLNQNCSAYNSWLNESFSWRSFSYNEKDTKLNEGLTKNEIENWRLVYMSTIWGTEDSDITHWNVFYSVKSNSCLLDIYRTATMGLITPTQTEIFELRDYIWKNIIYRKVCKKTNYKDIYEKVLDKNTRIFIEDSEFVNCKKEFYNELEVYRWNSSNNILKKIINTLFGRL